jgi:hypothetical protein
MIRPKECPKTNWLPWPQKPQHHAECLFGCKEKWKWKIYLCYYEMISLIKHFTVYRFNLLPFSFMKMEKKEKWESEKEIIKKEKKSWMKKLSEVFKRVYLFHFDCYCTWFSFSTLLCSVLSSFDTSCHGQKGIIYKLTWMRGA